MRSTEAAGFRRLYRRGVCGFTLLEAMVAMVIIGGVGMTLFSWINASIVSLRRVEDANARSAATANVIEFMQSINPMQSPVGRTDLGAYSLQWSAKAQAAPIDGTEYPRGLSQFQLALYDTDVQARQLDGSFWFELRLTLVGYKKVRDTVLTQ